MLCFKRYLFLKHYVLSPSLCNWGRVQTLPQHIVLDRRIQQIANWKGLPVCLHGVHARNYTILPDILSIFFRYIENSDLYWLSFMLLKVSATLKYVIVRVMIWNNQTEGNTWIGLEVGSLFIESVQQLTVLRTPICSYIIMSLGFIHFSILLVPNFWPESKNFISSKS